MGSDDEGGSLSDGEGSTGKPDNAVSTNGDSHCRQTDEAHVGDSDHLFERGTGLSAGEACARDDQAWPTAAACEEPEFDDFQAAGSLETFADFGVWNPALPSPTPALVVPAAQTELPATMPAIT